MARVFDSMWAFRPVRFRSLVIVSPHSHFSSLSLSLSTSLFITLSLYHTIRPPRFICCPSFTHLTVLPGTPCEPPWIRHVTLLFCSLLSLSLSLFTFATERCVLVCSCCFLDTFTPAPRFAAEEWGLEVKQV